MPFWLPPLLAVVPVHLQGLGATLGYQGFCGELLASFGRRAYGGEAETFVCELLLLVGLILQGGVGFVLLFLHWALPEVSRGVGEGLGRVSLILALLLVALYGLTRLWGLPLPTPYGWAWGGPAPADGLGLFLVFWEGLVGLAFWKGRVR